jgi:hypothetical protein
MAYGPKESFKKGNKSWNEWLYQNIFLKKPRQISQLTFEFHLFSIKTSFSMCF